MADAVKQPDEMYVGYLPVPRGQKMFLRRIVPVAVMLLVVGALLWARSQHSPGRGIWDTEHPVQLRGVLVARPYPMLLTTGEDGEPEFVLLVEKGKHGPRSAEALDGGAVVVLGSVLKRDGRRMLELDDGARGLVIDPGVPNASLVPSRRALGRVTLRGEIIDPKCYLGAMKPGQGKTHKECATLCIRGGIPPMFVTHDDRGQVTYYLLQSLGGGPADPAIHPFIADPVEVAGELTRWGGLNIISVDPSGIRRL